MKRSAKNSGFTFVEVLAALVFLGILMPVVISALMVSNRAGLIAERSANALQLGENRLGQLLVANEWSSSESRGEFGEPWRGYRWELERQDWPDGVSMTELTMRVFFSVQGREHEVQMTTLASATQL